jgi:hypothetical protein
MKNNQEENLAHPIPGIIYQHYKSGLYEPIYVATHTTTGEKMVIYKSHTEGTIYARPLKEWNDEVEVNTNKEVIKVVRFKIFSADDIK